MKPPTSAAHKPLLAQARDRFVNLDGLPFHYVTWEGNGPSLVLVHGTGFHAYVWKPLARALSDAFHVLAFDQRGHGDSGKPPSGYAWDIMAGDLARFLDALDLRQVIAVGHSAGATAIAGVVARRPGRITRAVLIDPILFPRFPAAQVVHNPLADAARKRRMVWTSRTALFHSYRVRDPFKTWREDVLWAYIEEGTTLRGDGSVVLKCPGAIEAQVFENAPYSDGFELLPRVTVPVLLLRGEHSTALPRQNAERAARLLPTCTFITVPDTTHFVPMERPDLVEQEVRRFIAA